MHGEAPQFKRCCFCLPLRRGLIAWGYAKLVLNCLEMIYITYAIIYWFAIRANMETKTFAILATINICLLIDIFFNIVFIVAGHKKNAKLLKICYVYNLVWLGFLVLVCGFQLYVNLRGVYRMWENIEYHKYFNYFVLELLINSGFCCGLIFVQVYMTLMIRSEMIKLQNQAIGMQFTNHASGESQCTLQHASGTEQCTDEKHAVHVAAPCTDEKQSEIDE